MQIPVGHVICFVAKNGRALEQARHKIDPLLVDEQALGNVDAAAVDQSLLPPVEAAAVSAVSAQPDEAQVVGAGAQDGLLVGNQPVPWDWLE